AFDVLSNADHYGLHDFTLFDAPARYRLLDRYHDHVTNGGIALLGAAKDLDAHDPARARVVGDVEVSLHLDHGALLLSSRAHSRSDGRCFLLALDHFPALELRQWPSLLYRDQITHLEFVLLVVGVILLRASHGL